MSERLRLVYFGSGAFGLPTLEALNEAHEIALVVSQPDRPAGRKRQLTPTPVSEWAAARGIDLLRTDAVNGDEARATIEAVGADAFVVIAFGAKLSPALLAGRFAINLHSSLLPQYRGAAPINRSMMAGDAETGVSVIGLAAVMDAGGVYARRSLAIDPRETAGELHDRLAALGPEVVMSVLADRATITPQTQDDAVATPAPKLTKAEGTTDFDLSAPLVRARIHGLTPWPGCTVMNGEERLRLHRCRDIELPHEASPGTVLDGRFVACRSGAIELLEVQAPGGRVMSMEDFTRGRSLAAHLRALDA